MPFLLFQELSIHKEKNELSEPPLNEIQSIRIIPGQFGIVSKKVNECK